MHPTDRVAVVGAGFGVWRGGRHHASARWTDIMRVRASRCAEPTTDLLCVRLSLRDGTEILLPEELPGFEAFLAAAETRLPGMQPRSAWRAASANATPAPNETVVFERGTRAE